MVPNTVWVLLSMNLMVLMFLLLAKLVASMFEILGARADLDAHRKLAGVLDAQTKRISRGMN